MAHCMELWCFIGWSCGGSLVGAVMAHWLRCGGSLFGAVMAYWLRCHGSLGEDVVVH